jgi:hypothetical protein
MIVLGIGEAGPSGRSDQDFRLCTRSCPTITLTS